MVASSEKKKMFEVTRLRDVFKGSVRCRMAMLVNFQIGNLRLGWAVPGLAFGKS